MTTVNPAARAKAPEYVDPELMTKVDGLRDGFSKSMRVPTATRARLTSVFTAATETSVALLVGGVAEERDGSDTEILFRQESNFIYLTGFDHPGATVVVATGSRVNGLSQGEAWLFVPHGNAVWTGRTETLEDFKERYDVTDVFWIEDLPSKLDSANPDTVYTFAGVNPYIPDSAEHDVTALRSILGTARSVKTSGEIEMIRAATDITAEEHKLVMRNIKCGEYESDAESLFRFIGHNYGARFQSYIPIVGAGPNAAALHYNDNDMMIPSDGLVLIDAAAEFGSTRNGGGWTSDITRTWPCSGTYSTLQRGIYDAVYKAQSAAMELVKAGGSFSQCTSASDRAIVEGLLAVGILKGGTVDELLSAGMVRIFMPHGLGHSVGLDVHDPGSMTPFVAGMVLTVEPGIYFIDAQLDAALGRPDQAKYLDEATLSQYRGFGGVRIEDTLLVTADGYENLSADIPRSADDVERWMRDGVFEAEPAAPSHGVAQQ